MGFLRLWHDDQKETDEIDDNFIDDRPVEEDVSFYRERDAFNANDYPRFLNQTRDPLQAVHEDSELFYGHEDQQPELYAPQDRSNVTFDTFKGFEKSIKKFNETLKNFEESQNQLFDGVIYGLMFLKTNDEGQIRKSNMLNILEEKLLHDLKDMEDETELNRTLFGFFNRCFKLDQVISKYGYFLKFFKRRDNYRFLIKKKSLWEQ